MEQMSLDNILKDKERAAAPAAPAPAPEAAPAAPAPAPVAEAAPEPAPQQNVPSGSLRKAHREREQLAKDDGRARDPATGKFVEKEAAPAPEAGETAAPAKAEPEMSSKEKALLAAAQDERGKRQEFERKYKELEAKLAQAPAPAAPAAPAEPAKTFWDDPEAALARHQAEVRGMMNHERLVFSENMARSRHPDFDEKIDVFEELMKETPALRQQMMASPDPATFAYKTSKAHMELREAGNLDELRAKIEKETRIKVEAEMKDKAEKDAAARAREKAALPGSLSNVTGVGGVGAKPIWAGPTPLDSILKS